MKKTLVILFIGLMLIGSVLSIYGSLSIKSSSFILGISALLSGSVLIVLSVFCAMFAMDVDK